MTDRRLERIEVAGFTSIRFASVELGQLNVLVGANGAGKSNFIHALALLGRIVDSELNLFVGLNGGAGALLNSSDSGARIGLRLDANPNSYEATLVPAANDELVFDDELIFFTEMTIPIRGGTHLVAVIERPACTTPSNNAMDHRLPGMWSTYSEVVESSIFTTPARTRR